MMMKVVVLCCVVVVALADEKYTDKYDNIDLKDILENKRLLRSYVDCILDKGKCTPEGKELREHLSEAIENECLKCTESQRNGTETVISHLIEHEPKIFNELSAKFDPTGKFRKKYEDLANSKGIKLPPIE